MVERSSFNCSYTYLHHRGRTNYIKKFYRQSFGFYSLLYRRVVVVVDSSCVFLRVSLFVYLFSYLFVVANLLLLLLLLLLLFVCLREADWSNFESEFFIETSPM